MPEITGKHLQWQLNILCVKVVISTTVGMSTAFLNFPAPSALFSLLLVTDSALNRIVWPSFLGCHLAWLASSAFCRLKLFAFLEYDTRINSGGRWRVVTALYQSKCWALSQALHFYWCWSLSSFRRILVPFHCLSFQLFVRPHSFRRWHHHKKFSSVWSASHHQPYRSRLWSCACGAFLSFSSFRPTLGCKSYSVNSKVFI